MTDTAVGLRGLRRRAAAVAAVCGVAAAAGLLLDRVAFLRGWLVGVLFCAGLSVGSIAILMLHHMVGGAWGFVIRRPLEAAAGLVPLVALSFVPVGLRVHDLYEWSHESVVAADPVLRHKAAWLAVPFFLARAAGCFVVWTALAILLRRGSLAIDRGDTTAADRLRRLSGPGVVLVVLTTTVAAVDWAMSLEPHWVSAIYGLMVLMGWALAALALANVAVAALRDVPPVADVLTRSRLHDLGKLTFAFVMLWAYLSFSQYLVVWSGNLPEEIPWYLHRTAGGWRWVALAIVALHFVVPFVVLLSAEVKKRALTLACVCLVLLVMRVADVAWLVLPAFRPAGLALHWLDVIAPAALVSVWLLAFIVLLGRRPLIPQRWLVEHGHDAGPHGHGIDLAAAPEGSRP